MRYKLLLVAWLVPALTANMSSGQEPDQHDWPTYNRDVVGTRHNPAEKTLSKDNVGQLVEKWRFPRQGAEEKIGVVHSTVVVNGYVYFGTANDPTFFKLTPDGKLKWSFKAKERDGFGEFGTLPTGGFMNAALVTSDTVYAGDIGGMIYALDRANGKPRWTVDTRAKPFPGAHSSHCIFAAPIRAKDKVVIAGGGFEHGVALNFLKPCCTGRGFVVALEPATGKVVWKYDVGPEPQKLDPPVKIKDAWGEHTFSYGPSTSSVWCTPSYDADSDTIFFGTDTHNAPRQPTKDDPKLHNKYSCAMIAVDAATGKDKWVTQINPGDVWNLGLRAYDPKTGLYKDQSIGDTPKIFFLWINGRRVRVIAFGCKNGGFYILNADTGEILFETPRYTGPPVHPPINLNPRTIALPGAIGGIQTGCATDGKAIFTNGIDNIRLYTNEDPKKQLFPPTGGRVVSISMDTKTENWRHERPTVKKVGSFKDVGDPVGSGIALANGVAYFTTTVSNKLVAVDTANGKTLKEIDLGPVWCGPTVSRGRVYVGTGNLLFYPSKAEEEGYFPKTKIGSVRSFGLPGLDEVSKMAGGSE